MDWLFLILLSVTMEIKIGGVGGTNKFERMKYLKVYIIDDNDYNWRTLVYIALVSITKRMLHYKLTKSVTNSLIELHTYRNNTPIAPLKLMGVVAPLIWTLNFEME